MDRGNSFDFFLERGLSLEKWKESTEHLFSIVGIEAAKKWLSACWSLQEIFWAWEVGLQLAHVSVGILRAGYLTEGLRVWTLRGLLEALPGGQSLQKVSGVKIPTSGIFVVRNTLIPIHQTKLSWLGVAILESMRFCKNLNSLTTLYIYIYYV